jgi:SRSO17 transposase
LADFEGHGIPKSASDWKEELGRFLEPFLARLGHKARRQMCPLYVSGLIGPGDRKSIQPMAEPAVGEEAGIFFGALAYRARPINHCQGTTNPTS